MRREEIERTVGKLSAYDYGEPTTAIFEIDRLINQSHGDPQARSWIEDALAAVIVSGASLAAKQEACRRLWRIGTDRSLDSLRQLLEADDPRVVAAGCYALGRRPSAKADKMLMATVEKAPAQCRPTLEHLIEDRG